MKIRIWVHGEGVDMYADQWVILPDRSLIGVRRSDRLLIGVGWTVINNIFYDWEKIEVWPGAM